MLVPHAPVLVAGFREVLWLDPDGEIEALAPADARSRVERETPMLCHAPATARRLDTPGFPGARSARALRIRSSGAVLRADAARSRRSARPAAAAQLAGSCVTLATVARALLEKLAEEVDPEVRAIAEAMDRGGWLWGPAVLAALPPPSPAHCRERPAFACGCGSTNGRSRPRRRRPATSRCGPRRRARGSPSCSATAPSRGRSKRLRRGGHRPAFAPRDQPDQPQAVLAEAGTGVGKTLGYIAAASLWAEKNRGSVWISTYTRNLQTQIAGELDRLYPDPRKNDATS